MVQTLEPIGKSVERLNIASEENLVFLDSLDS
jgi:hypothetical protein